MAGVNLVDERMAGLVAPRRSYAVGRPDLAPDLRPGALLVALVGDFARNGGFDRSARRPAVFDDAPPAPRQPEPLAAPAALTRWFDDEEPENDETRSQ